MGVGSAGGSELGGFGGELGGTEMSCSGQWNKILLETQSIHTLWRVSQLCPRTREQDPYSAVTYSVVTVMSPVWKQRERSIAWVIVEFVVPLKSRSWMGGTGYDDSVCSFT